MMTNNDRIDTVLKITDGIFVVDNFMDDNSNRDFVSEIEEQCVWEEFTINNKPLCRMGSFQGDQIFPHSNGSWVESDTVVQPWLRCPSIENRTIYPWTPVIEEVRDTITEKLNFNTNIGKIQKYISGSGIHSHSDKIIDIDDRTPIFVARFGAPRRCVLRNKITDEEIVITVSHNSLLCITYEANLFWTHGILPDVSDGPSYSIVFRQSITYLHPSGYVYGKNTPFKMLSNLEDFINLRAGGVSQYYSRETQKKKMIECYNVENKRPIDISLYKDIIKNAIYPF